MMNIQSLGLGQGTKDTVGHQKHTLNKVEIQCSLPNVAMSGHVSIEIRDVAKCLVTDTTLVRRGRTMRCLMFLQMGFLPKSLMAHHTLKWSLACGERGREKNRLKIDLDTR